MKNPTGGFKLEFVVDSNGVDFQELPLVATSLDAAKTEAKKIADTTPNFLLGQIQQLDGLVLGHVTPESV